MTKIGNVLIGWLNVRDVEFNRTNGRHHFKCWLFSHREHFQYTFLFQLTFDLHTFILFFVPLLAHESDPFFDIRYMNGNCLSISQLENKKYAINFVDFLSFWISKLGARSDFFFLSSKSVDFQPLKIEED